MTGSAHAESWGVATGYHDYAGRWREPPARTVAAVLESMGAGPDTPPPPRAVTVRTDHPLPDLGPGLVTTEDGRHRRVSGPLPADLPTGYHRFRPDRGPDHPLIVSPGQVPLPAGRQWGFASQVYATRSSRSWGIGDMGDLRRLNEWARGLGAGFTLVSPLHAATPTHPRQASPYFPGSRCFLDPMYISVEEAPGAAGVAGQADAESAGRALNRDSRIDRDRVWALKAPVLEQMFARTQDAPDFLAYLKRRGGSLDRFSLYCAVAEEHGPEWASWPARAEHHAPPRRRAFHSWLQWVVESQAEGAGRALDLVVDLAVGVDPTGPDSWIWRDHFARGMRVGAPPDEFNTQGQNWGLPPFDPWRLRAAAFEPWIEVLRSGLGHGGGLRVDHVMGLFRQYWIPEGAPPGDGTYVSYPHHDLLNILALEADRAGAYVVGEDLGTVQDEVRRDLAGRRILSYRVWWFESLPTAQWPEAAMGAVTTHDLPTVAGVLTGSDLAAQRRIGTEPNEEASARLLERLRSRWRRRPTPGR